MAAVGFLFGGAMFFALAIAFVGGVDRLMRSGS